MKRFIAILCAALPACLCFACGQVKPRPTPVPSALLLTLYADTKPMLRIVTQQEGVAVALQKLEYEPTVGFLRPIADEWEETLTPGREYEIHKELAELIPEYRLLVRQGENMAIHNLSEDLKDGNEVFEIEGKPWRPAPIDENSPMINLCRAAAVSPKEEQYDYWYAVSNAITTQRGVYNEWPPDDPESGAYRVPAWLFEAYAAALFPDTDMPEYVDWDWVGYDDTNEEYLAYLSYSTWIWADYKSAKQNPDGTWDVTVTISAEGSDETMDEVIKLAPNAAYNPNSPFEYHIVGMPEPQPPEPAIPPPGFIVGTWRAAQAKPRHAAYLEIYEDGIAGLYLGDDESGQLYEIYRGLVACDPSQESETSWELYMRFDLDWYIYEGETDPVPERYSGDYTLRHAWEGDQQVLHVKANEGADPLFGKSELKMLWAPKTQQGDFMADIESMG